jgi:hypothetical protein
VKLKTEVMGAMGRGLNTAWSLIAVIKHLE